MEWVVLEIKFIYYLVIYYLLFKEWKGWLDSFRTVELFYLIKWEFMEKIVKPVRLLTNE